MLGNLLDIYKIVFSLKLSLQRTYYLNHWPNLDVLTS